MMMVRFFVSAGDGTIFGQYACRMKKINDLPYIW
ncbi:hypothetical protein C818_01067 [Lachnospiraceae bacterium MD308]|nr:hypothetical protein C818_01067 [Lachnospiraceae bacterium MD308]